MTKYSTKETSRRLRLLERRLKREYEDAYKGVDKKLRDYLALFEKREATMKAGLAAGTVPIPAGYTAESYFNQWRLNQIARGEQWKALRDELARLMVEINQTAAERVNGQLPDIYKLNADYDAFCYEQAHPDASFTLVDERTAEELGRTWKNHTEFQVSDGMGGYTYRKLQVDKKVDYQWNTRRIKSALTQGILQGEGIPKIATRFYNIQMANWAAAVRNARTAVTSAQNAAAQNTAEHAESIGIKGLRKGWLCTHDGRTRKSHVEAGETYHDYESGIPVSEKFIVGDVELAYPAAPAGAPKEVYNCRCTMVTYDPLLAKMQENEPEKFSKTAFEEWRNGKVR